MLAAATNKKTLITTLLAFAVFCAAYSATLATLLSHWLAFDGNQSHAIAVILLTAYLIAQKLRSCSYPAIRIHSVGVLLTLVLSLFWYLAAIASIDIIEQLLLLPLLATIFYTLMGRRQTLDLIPTLGLLIFVIPIWDYLVPGLVRLSSIVVGDLVEMSRIPALIDGNSFYLPDGKVDIVGGCSGVKYLTIALFISYYILLTSRSSLMQKSLLLLLALVLSIAMNWVRIFSIILVAYYSKMESQLVSDHETYGWILFAIVLIPIIAIGRRFPTRSPENTSQIAPTTGTNTRQQALALVLLCVAMAVGPVALYTSQPVQPETTNSNPFAGIDGINAQPMQGTGLLTIDHAKTLQVFRLQTSQGELYAEVAEHWQTERDEKLVPYISRFFDNNLWTLKSQQTIPLSDGQSVRLMQLQQKPYGISQLVVMWFTVGSYKTDSYSSAKLLQIPAIMLGQNIFRITALRAECNEPMCESTRSKLTQVAEPILDSEAF